MRSTVTAHYEVDRATLAGEQLLDAVRRVVAELPTDARPWTNARPGRLPPDGEVEVSVTLDGHPSAVYLRGVEMIAQAVARADRAAVGLSEASMVWSGAVPIDVGAAVTSQAG